MFPLGIKQTFEAAKILGYGSVEILVTQQSATRNYELLDGYQQEYQIPIVSIHAPTLLATAFVYGTHGGKKTMKTATLATKLNVNTVVVHPPTRLKKKYAGEFLNFVYNIEEETGVNIAVENMFPWRAGGKTREIYTPSWDMISQSDLVKHLTLDFSHAALSGMNALQEVKDHFNKIRHIHFCDGHGYKLNKAGDSKDKVFDEHLIPGEGSQPIKEVINHLVKNDWNGNVVAEINTRKHLSFDKKLVMLEKTKSFFDECYSSTPA